MAFSLRDLYKKLQGGVQAIKKPLPPPVVIKPTAQQMQSPRVQQAYQQSQPYIQAAQNAYKAPQREVQPQRSFTYQAPQMPRVAQPQYNLPQPKPTATLRSIAPNVRNTFSTMGLGMQELKEQFPINRNTIPFASSTKFEVQPGVKQAVDRFKQGWNKPQDVVSRSVRNVLSGNTPVQKSISSITQGMLPATREEAWAQGSFPISDKDGKITRTIDLTGVIGSVKSTGINLSKKALREVAESRVAQDIYKVLRGKAVGVADDVLRNLSEELTRSKTPEKVVTVIGNRLQGLGRKVAPSVSSAGMSVKNVGKQADPRNFKSAEEFVKAQGETVYHGTNQQFDEFKKIKGQDLKGATSKDGFWFTNSGDEARDYAEYSAKRNVPDRIGHEKKVNSLLKQLESAEKARNFDLVDKLTQQVEELEVNAMRSAPSGQRVVEANLYYKNPKIIKAETLTSEQGSIISKAKKEGHDAVIFENIADSPFGGRTTTQTVVFDPSKIKTKSQLTDIYNQAKLDPTNTQAGGIKVGSLVPRPMRKLLGIGEDVPVSSKKSPLASLKPSQLAQPELRGNPQSIASGKKTVSSTPFYNVDRISATPEGKKALQDALVEATPRIEQTVGRKLSNKEVADYAAATSKVMDTLVTRKASKVKIAANMNLRDSIANGLSKGTMTPELVEAMIKDKAAGADIARQLQARVRNANPAERTLINEVLDAVLKGADDTDAVLEAAKKVDFNDQQQMIEFYRKFIAPRAEDWMDKLRYSSMLSSPTTHAVNISSNFQGTGIIAPIEKTVAGTLDFLRAGITGGERTQYAGEGAAHAKGYWENIGAAARRAGDVMSGKLQSMNPDVRNIPLTTKPGVARTVEKTLDLPMKALEAMDQFFTAMTEGGSKKALEYRVSKGTSVGNIANEAAKEAQYRLFRGDLSGAEQGPILDALDSVTKTLFSLRSDNNVLVRTVAKFTFPFVKTPMNLLKQGIEYSPLGFTTLPGAANKTQQLSKALIGTSVAGASAILLGSGRLSWAEPTNLKEKNEYRAAGKQPYSVKIGDTWVSYSKLHPAISFPMALMASLDDALNNKKIDESQTNAVLAGLSQWIQFYADQSYLRNMGDFLSAAKGDISGPARYISNYPQQFIPFRAMLGYINRIIDPTQRLPDSKNPIEKQFQYMLTQIPLLSGTVPARTTEDGAVVLNNNTLINAISPVRVSTERDNVKPFISVSKTGQTKVKATASSGIYENAPDFNTVKTDVISRMKSGELTPQNAAEVLRVEKTRQMAQLINSKPELAPKLAPLYIKELKKGLKSKAISIAKDTDLTTAQKKEAIQKLKDDFIEQVKAQAKYLKQSTAPTSNRTAVNILPSLGPITGIDGSSLWKWGLDVDLQKGQPVPAAVGGQVIASARNGGFGNQVKILGDDGREYWYSHLDKRIAPGQRVNAGQIIGLGGNTGNVIPGRGGDGSHLDLTVVENGRYIPARNVAALLKSYS
tara:strand:- start:6458 stop:10870 length:4413 start_codon:yes stop_codon:yes gene_type:complete